MGTGKEVGAGLSAIRLLAAWVKTSRQGNGKCNDPVADPQGILKTRSCRVVALRG